ncbi:MAG TPA: glycosyltransferase family 39 protein [Acidimicrobiales bacterium]|nr:glycosyltransferase family 39 protein [Acidimicrobiales bacterium]
MRSTSRVRASLIAILAVAAALRIGWSAYAARPPSGSLHDPNFYLLYGEQIARGHGYVLPGTLGPSAYYPVGYPIVLAIVNFVLLHSLGDHPIGAAVAVNVVFGVGGVALIFLIGRRLAGDAVALAAAAVMALYPNLVYHTAVALTETVFNGFFLLFVLIVVDAPWSDRRFERGRLIGLGALLGVCVLTRPVALPLVAALFVVWMLAGFGWRRALAYGAVVGGVAVLVVSPWIIRNIRVMHEATLSTNTGDNLCMSRHVGASGTFQLEGNPCFQGFDGLPRPAFETERDSRNRQLALDFVREHPADEVQLWFKRIYRAFKDDWDGSWAAESYGDAKFMSNSTRDVVHDVGSYYYVGTMLLTVAGSVLIIRRQRGRLHPGWSFVGLAFLATIVLPVVVTFGDSRFHVPALPLFALMSGVALVALRDRVRRRS